MKVITVKYINPTNHRGSRLKVSDNDGNNLTVPYVHAMNDEERVARAALQFLQEMGWGGRWVMGSIAGPRGCDVLVGDPRSDFDSPLHIAGFMDDYK